MGAGVPARPPDARVTGAVFEKTGRLAAVGIGFSIPISTAADNVLLALAAVCFLGAGRYRERYAAVKANPVFLASLALYAALGAGALYGPATPKEAALHLLKYADLLFVPILAAFFRDAATRRLGLYAFAAAITVVLLLSSALSVGLIPRSGLFAANSPYAVVFKQSLTHSILVAFGAFLFVQLAAAARSNALRGLWCALAAAAVLNIVLLVPGRTGYVVLLVLSLYLGYGWRRWTGVTVMIAVSGLALALAYGGSLPFRERVDRAVQEYASWKPGAAATSTNAVGLRLEFYRNSLEAVRDRPLFGAGTGGFPRAYAEQVKGTDMLATSNPHNEYLLVAVQLGLAGLALLLVLFYTQWRNAPLLASMLERHLARALVLAFAAGCLFNSLLLDHAEGLLFAWLTALLYAGLQSKVS